MTKIQLSVILSDESLKVFPLELGTKQNFPLLLFYVTILEDLTTAFGEEEIKGIKLEEKEVKLSLFVGYMTIYIENPKISMKELFSSVQSFNRVRLFATP